MTRTYTLAAVFALVVPAIAAADPAEHAHPSDEGVRAARRYDDSRFSDGPRRVPTPRGASFTRAQALGLGTREAASIALRGQAPERWLRAAAWRGESVERLLWPIDEGRYVRGHGYVRTTRPDLIHKGVDIAAPTGSVVRAAADGIVVYSDNGLRGYGNCVVIAHPNGWVTLYAHASRTTVQAGWRVRRGERIALVGSTGISRGPHLHFELRQGARSADPLALFDGGPAFVQRLALGAARLGRVAAPQPLSAIDRETPPPLAPFEASDATGGALRAQARTRGRRGDEPDAAAPQAQTGDASRSLEADAEGSGDDDLRDSVGGLAIGSTALLRRLNRGAPTEAMASAAGGRIFRNLLWPMRGGALTRASRNGVELAAEAPTAVRVAADGLVVHVATRGGRSTVTVLHRMGWVTTYALETAHVSAGQHVARGEWIGESRALKFEARIEGRRVDPRPLFVQAPR